MYNMTLFSRAAYLKTNDERCCQFYLNPLVGIHVCFPLCGKGHMVLIFIISLFFPGKELLNPPTTTTTATAKTTTSTILTTLQPFTSQKSSSRQQSTSGSTRNDSTEKADLLPESNKQNGFFVSSGEKRRNEATKIWLILISKL